MFDIECLPEHSLRNPKPNFVESSYSSKDSNYPPSPRLTTYYEVSLTALATKLLKMNREVSLLRTNDNPKISLSTLKRGHKEIVFGVLFQLPAPFGQIPAGDLHLS